MEATERFRLYRYIAVAAGVVLSIAITWVPIEAARPIVDSLAGRSTKVTVAITAAISFSLILGGAAAAMLVKMNGQKKELIRLRKRLEQYEKRPGQTEEMGR